MIRKLSLMSSRSVRNFLSSYSNLLPNTMEQMTLETARLRKNVGSKGFSLKINKSLYSA